MAHVGHGDQFQQEGDVQQITSDADTDALLGVLTARPEQGADGLTVPVPAVVDAEGQPLVFIKTATTYDPVFVQTGATIRDRIVISDGVSLDEDVVIQGALSLYAESRKSEQANPADQAPEATPAQAENAGPVAQPIGPGTVGIAAGALAVVAAGVFAVSKLRNRKG